ncbi:MAG: hypothetical protein ACTSUV_02205, partial [Candidatus Ranarchaeia archaeon]
SKMLGKEVSAGVFIIFALVFSFQIHWGIYTTSVQSYAEIKPGNVIYDYLQGFEFIRNQIGEGTVIASWWDYGYWITSTTNASSLCDNATVNSTQIARVGYALMETNISHSVEIFRELQSDYVFVNFGLLNPNLGISGDEGKWIWMVRICEDVANSRNETWLVTGDYYNETSGEIQGNFYNSTLYKLLRYNEPGGIYEQYVGINSNQDWLDNPVDEDDIPFFNLRYFSDGHIFKLYEIDYDEYDQYVNATT